MPKYKNSTTAVITTNGIRIEPGQTVETTKWIPTLPTGITLVATTPAFAPAVYSSTFSGSSGNSGVQTLPTTLSQNRLTVFCSAGAIKFYTNDMSTGVVIVAGDYRRYDLLEYIVKNFNIDYLVASSVCEVSVE